MLAAPKGLVASGSKGPRMACLRTVRKYFGSCMHAAGVWGGWHVEANCKVVQWFKYAWSGVPQVQSEYQVRKKVSHIRLARNTCNKLVRDFCLHARVCVMDVGEFVLHRHRHTCICTNERAQQDLNVPLC